MLTVKNCGNPGTPYHGRRSGNRFTYGSFVNYYCDTGYKRQGPAYQQCLASGKWSGTRPTCSS